MPKDEPYFHAISMLVLMPEMNYRMSLMPKVAVKIITQCFFGL
jgi:hypothetical protein